MKNISINSLIGETTIEYLINRLHDYSNENSFFYSVLSANFFLANKNIKETPFGRDQFILNFMSCLFSYDKINKYKYVINEWR
jgi:hypothetical protein